MSSLPTILFVEDCEEAVPALEIALESAFGCAVRHCAEVEHALGALNEGALLLQAVITDLNFPGADGFALIETVRKHPRWNGVPVLVVSANTERSTPGRVAALGANAFFGKPCSPAAVCECLERILHAKQPTSCISDRRHIERTDAG